VYGISETIEGKLESLNESKKFVDSFDGEYATIIKRGGETVVYIALAIALFSEMPSLPRPYQRGVNRDTVFLVLLAALVSIIILRMLIAVVVDVTAI
jgi:hypothetical protein